LVVQEWAELLLGSRNQLMHFIGNVRRMLPSVDDDSIKDTIFLTLLKVYTAVANLNDIEQDVCSNGKKRAGDFLDNFARDFKELITTGHEQKIHSYSIIDAFLDFLSTIIDVFASFNNFGVKIHAPAFAEYLRWADHTTGLHEKCDQVRSKFNRC
jgi:hypothetical protein